MTAPELVEALRTAICDAVECTPYWVAHKPETHQDPYENAARAVLAALTEAGTVEWGVRWPGDDEPDEIGLDRDYIADECMPHILMPGEVPPELVSRLVFPWTAVEQP